MNIDQIVLIINELGYPILMTLGMGYFIWYVWQYVTKKLKPTISASHKMLINLLDQIRMLDNDLIRLQQKVNTVVEYRKQQEAKDEAHNVPIRSTKSTRK
jgi:aspartokinase-like uncharacterized kinase